MSAPKNIESHENSVSTVQAKKSGLLTLKGVSNLHFSTLPGLKRRPPKSKHDFAIDQKAPVDKSLSSLNSQHRFPSSEAAHRMLIGTMMLQNGGNSKSGSSLANHPKAFQTLHISKTSDTINAKVTCYNLNCHLKPCGPFSSILGL